jgi:hypothetical protein
MASTPMPTQGLVQWSKEVLTYQLVQATHVNQQQQQQQQTGKVAMMELNCRAGSDVGKFARSGVSSYLGVDPVSDNITRAQAKLVCRYDKRERGRDAERKRYLVRYAEPLLRLP